MSTMTFAPNISRRAPLTRRRRTTSAIIDAVLAPTINQVLESWKQGSAATAVTRTPVVAAYPGSAVEAVDYITAVLNVPTGDVLRAVNIAERTYYGWKKAVGRKPRPSAEGKLWLMTEVIYALASRRPHLGAWMRTNSAARAAFDAGDVSGLQLIDLQQVTAGRPSTITSVPVFGDPGDPVPDTPTATRDVERPTVTTRSSRPLVPGRRKPDQQAAP